MGKSPDQVVPALCRKFPLWGGTPFKTVETIGDNDSACLGFGQNFAWEIVGDSEVETVTPLQIVAPFPVAGEILSRGFHFNNGDRTTTVDSDDIDPAAALQGEFAKACVATFDKHAGDGIGNSGCGDMILIVHPQRLAQPGRRRHAAVSRYVMRSCEGRRR